MQDSHAMLGFDGLLTRPVLAGLGADIAAFCLNGGAVSDGETRRWRERKSGPEEAGSLLGIMLTTKNGTCPCWESGHKHTHYNAFISSRF